MKYLTPTFDELIKKSYNYDQEEQRISSDWKLIRKLYDKNYIKGNDSGENIPKIIHQIWLGGDLPDEYKRFTESWHKFNPSWQYKLWTAWDVPSLNMEKKDLFDKATNYGPKGDIMRHEILRQYGGLYVDTDFECIRSFDDLSWLDFFCGISTDAKLILHCALVACVPNHPIINKCIDDLKDVYCGNDGNEIMSSTGPYYFTHCFLDSVNKKTTGVVAFPMDYFYPFPNFARWYGNPYSYVTQCTYAIHHWKSAWMK